MKSRIVSLTLLLGLIALWIFLSENGLYREDLFPYFRNFVRASIDEFASLRPIDDIIASFYRWICGFLIAILIGIPLGLVLGKRPAFKSVLAPYLNIMRSLSPLAWIPFAVIWFGIGDSPVIFLIFLGCFFPLLFNTINAVMGVPKVYDQLAKDYAFEKNEYFFKILFPAVLPQIVSSLRLVAGLGWIVLVPAEMLAGKEGLGFAILDARNGMRTDLLLFNMLLIALLSHGIDSLLNTLNSKAQVKWGHEQ